ncbi:penicillin-binding protein 2 [bacterium]|nr:penicillin-binding protein 2 [bacterium]
MIGREDEVKQYRTRIWIFQVPIILGFLILGGRLFYLQVLRGDELRSFSEANRLKKEKVVAARGRIYDRNGKVIIDNRAAFDAVLVSQYYSFEEKENRRLASALRISPPEFEKKMSKINRGPSYAPGLLKADIGKELIAAIETDSQGFRGVDIESNVQRKYHFGEVSAQLFGYVSEVGKRDIKSDSRLQQGDYIGRTGLERFYDSELRGMDGVGYVEVDARGRRRRTENNDKILGYFSRTEPNPGNSLYLTIDIDLSQIANQSMKDHGFNGTVIALDPQSGEILTMVNQPSYDPGKISGREVDPYIWSRIQNNRDRPMRNRAIQDIYMPGSTFKTIVGVAALGEGVVSKNKGMECHGFIKSGNHKLNCWKTHGWTDFVKAIRESCNVYFSQLGAELGIDTIARYARLFGFGSPTGVLPSGEQKGVIPDTQWKQATLKQEWMPGETLSAAIGQGYVTITPIQLVNAYSTIATEGVRYKPFLIRRIERPNGEVVKEFKPEKLSEIKLGPEVWKTIKEGLFQVVNQTGGTASVSGRSKKTIISGKTGTAQVRGFSDISKIKNCMALPIDQRHHGWFVGYAPREKPEIAVVALAEHSCHGSSAAPIVRDVIDGYFDKQNLEKGIPIEESVKKGEKPKKGYQVPFQEMDE